MHFLKVQNTLISHNKKKNGLLHAQYSTGDARSTRHIQRSCVTASEWKLLYQTACKSATEFRDDGFNHS